MIYSENWYNAASVELAETEILLGTAYENWLEAIKEDTPGENNE